MKYKVFFICLLVPLFSSCFLFINGNDESSYSTDIAWKSDSSWVNHYGYISLVDSAVYAFGEAAPGSGGELLVKVDANTGSVIWKTEPFPSAQLVAPIVIGEYVYIFINDSLIYSFEVETGELSAIIETDTENTGLEIEWNVIAYENYLCFGIQIGRGENYLAKLDTHVIDRFLNPTEPQHIQPEMVWNPQTEGRVYAQLVTRDNIIYSLSTSFMINDDPVELVGINMDTKTEVFHNWIDYDDGMAAFPLLINNDLIYILSESISAYNLNTGKQVFLKTFSDDTPDKEWYSSASSLGLTYHNGKIYYTNGNSGHPGDGDDYQNIFCIDAQTGELVWSDIPLDSESLGTNPIIHNNRMYVPHGYGLRVYNPKNGKLIGVDKSFCGAGMGRNLLYNNYMITVRCDENTGDGTLVAVNLGG
ncbi:MAG: PQQ-binding-like beta-propeller repeat protein [Prevotella sp.]|nr:PQQ-binding-like beta-propeller repeat protein [Prevotella sp.]